MEKCQQQSNHGNIDSDPNLILIGSVYNYTFLLLEVGNTPKI